MIIDTLENRHHYGSLHAGIHCALEFLATTENHRLPPGKYPIDGDNIFAIVDHCQGRGREASPLEVHRRYIDVQYVITGDEWMGWAPLADCRLDANGFDGENDVGFCQERATSWVHVAPGSFAVFFPSDAHAPLAGSGEVKKIVVKVAA